MTRILNWTHATTEVGERGMKRTRSATDAERLALVAGLGLAACDALDATYEIYALGGGRFRLRGTIDARMAQPCVVTLEPVLTQLKESFDVEFHPDREHAPGGGDEESEILSAPDVEPIEGGIIDAGRIIQETMSAALDPYPRKEGAEFRWNDPKAEESPASPFAALKRLKRDT